MNTLNFKVTLLSDVIINQRAATEGNQKTLDFIPGSAFLGIAAGIYKNITPEEAFALFHSGKVRYGDAHPLIDEKRTLKVPASWYKKKDDKEDNELYIHNGMPKDGLKDKYGTPVQVKQYREDFIVVNGENKVSKVEINKRFAIKSAYDSDKRCSEDAKMYGYESLQAGSEWCFEVVLDDDISPGLEEKLVQAIEGNKRVGRSSTAQYGLVKIEKTNEFSSGFEPCEKPKARDIQEPVVFVYAESRLIFFDKHGQPTFTPTSEQLGFTDGKICWDMSQIRTFQYAPYNNYRQTRDTDRMGIEKGSVFCLTGVTSAETEKWVGSYQNEGFGKVLINPEFLEYSGDKGEAKFNFRKEAKSDSKEKEKPVSKVSNSDLKFENQAETKVWRYLIKQSKEAKSKTDIYSAVNKFVESSLGKSFVGKDKFASQWGTIRSIAMQIQTQNTPLKPQEKKNLLLKKLFEEKDDPIKRKKVGVGYLKHGVALERWEYKSEQLEKFITGLNSEYAIEIVINLAAEMAKKCRRD